MFEPEHLFKLAVIAVVVWLLLRWGDLLFTAAAIWCVCRGDWISGAVMFFLACMIGTAKASYMFWARRDGYRGARA